MYQKNLKDSFSFLLRIIQKSKAVFPVLSPEHIKDQNPRTLFRNESFLKKSRKPKGWKEGAFGPQQYF